MFWPLLSTQPPSPSIWWLLPMNQDQSAQSVVPPCASIEVSSHLEKVSASAWFSTLQSYKDTWLNSEGHSMTGTSPQHPVSGDISLRQVRGCWSISKGHGGPCCLKHFLQELLLVLLPRIFWCQHHNFHGLCLNKPAETSIKPSLTLVLCNKDWLLLVAFLLLKTIILLVSVTLLISLLWFYIFCFPNFKVL